jgi:hypothetical protein
LSLRKLRDVDYITTLKRERMVSSLLDQKTETGMPKSDNPITRLWRWIEHQIVEDVPADIAVCEFDCRMGHCNDEELESCQRRLHRAAGELMPADQVLGHAQSKSRKGHDRS